MARNITDLQNPELRIYNTGAPTQKIRVIRFPTLKGAAHGGSDKIKAALS